MQTESRTYRKGRMSALPAAKSGAKAGQGEGERSQRNREDKRQLSERLVPTTEAGTALRTLPAPPRALPAPRQPAARWGPGGRVHLGDSSFEAHAFFWWGTKSGPPERWSEFHLRTEVGTAHPTSPQA